MRLLFFGMSGVFSRAPLVDLIIARFDICAIIVPRPAQSQPATDPIRLLPRSRAPQSDLPLTQASDPNIIAIARDAGIPIYEAHTLSHPQTLSTLTALKPDAICVACFPYLLPNHLITQFPSFNLHPSILPAYRGPAPLFWIFHDGLENAGATVHLMDAHADTGDIVAQERIALPDGIRYADAECVCSEHAARLLVEALRAMQTGALARTPQPRDAAPRAPNPTPRDYLITTDWSARRAFNFANGLEDGDYPIRIQIGERNFVVQAAIAFDATETISAPFKREGSRVKFQMAQGTLTILTYNL
ncbi:MAG: hypothetical protein HY327_07420 [Chloroflexi bacterium]|nr:hypothetical protein [Chloroflexota bacterium]